MTAAEFYLEDLKSKFTKIDPDQYYLAYSGGRDSHLLHWFIHEYLHETRIPSVFENTGLDLPVIRDRALANCDVIVKPAMRHMEIKEKFGIPCESKRSDIYTARYFAALDKGLKPEEMSRSIRAMVFRDAEATARDGRISQYAVSQKIADAVKAGTMHRVSAKCCTYLKKIPAKKYVEESGRKPILGIMQSESIARNASYKTCFAKNGTFSPIHDLTEDLKAQIEKEFDIPVPWIYKYTNQTGCAGCPYGIRYDRNDYYATNLELSSCREGHRNFILEYFKESYAFKGYRFNLVIAPEMLSLRTS